MDLNRANFLRRLARRWFHWTDRCFGSTFNARWFGWLGFFILTSTGIVVARCLLVNWSRLFIDDISPATIATARRKPGWILVLWFNCYIGRSYGNYGLFYFGQAVIHRYIQFDKFAILLRESEAERERDKSKRTKEKMNKEKNELGTCFSVLDVSYT